MRILSIETSCDDTAVAVVDISGPLSSPNISVLGHTVHSQIEHKEFGGVYPNLAKREHAKNLVPVLLHTLEQSGMKNTGDEPAREILETIELLLSREEGLFTQFKKEMASLVKPEIDQIAVTYGPGLEPALWVGISFAKALSLLWDVPVVPTNHMEGHLASVLTASPVTMPSLALLVSGGHTELVVAQQWGEYKVIGQTRDDAVGEAFDKVARMLSLPYPGGPEVSRLAALGRARRLSLPALFTLPRPMLKSPDFDFSFSGLKTAVLYTIQHKTLTQEEKEDVACEFENAVVEVLLYKTKKAIETYGSTSLIIGGGVVANTYLREVFQKEIHIPLSMPEKNLSTDNAVMIALASYIHIQSGRTHAELRAVGNLSLQN